MNPKIVLIGGTRRGLELLQFLIANKEQIVSAYIQLEDKHETQIHSDDMVAMCEGNQIPAITCKKITKKDVDKILALQPDVAFVCSWRTLFPSGLINSIPQGCLVAHDSLLPKYRGFAPTSWAIINGEKETGVTLFKINEGLTDSGEIFSQKNVPIGENETYEDIYPKLCQATVDLYAEFLNAVRKGDVKLREQNEAEATFTCKRTPADGEIDWNRSAEEIYNLTRALTPPYPYAWTKYKGNVVQVKKASIPGRQIRFAGNIPGRIVNVDGTGVTITCRSGQITIHELINGKSEAVSASELFTSITTTLGQ